VEIDKDVVRRILSIHHGPQSDSSGPSWLTFLGHMKDSLWRCDLFRCESATLRTYWVLVVMDQFTRRIVGFGVRCGNVDGPALCRMFQQGIRRQHLPKYLSTDNDSLYKFHQWQANLRVLDVTFALNGHFRKLGRRILFAFNGGSAETAQVKTLPLF
jgi:transposase InsO family protein